MIRGANRPPPPSLIVVVFMLQTTINPISIIVPNSNCMSSLTVYEALNQMRKLTRIGSPFSFEYILCNTSSQSSDGLKSVSKALLRTGLSRDKSSKSEILIGYTVEPESAPRWFYLPLLISLNGMKVTP